MIEDSNILVPGFVLFFFIGIMTMFHYSKTNKKRISDEILFSGDNPKEFFIAKKTFKGFRFPDLYLSINLFLQQYNNFSLRYIDSAHPVNLNEVLFDSFYQTKDALINKASNKDWNIDYSKVTYHPIDNFWVLYDSNRTEFIVRLRYNEFNDICCLETACVESKYHQQIIEEINNLAKHNSVYKNKLFSFEFLDSVSDEDGYEYKKEIVRVRFSEPFHIEEPDIVIEEKIKNILQRNIIDFHNHYPKLKEIGLRGQQGILFHGPPGTGKTYTCKYLLSQLKDITKIYITGHNLHKLKSIISIARSLEPAILIIEDVDLIFTSREINLYSTSLGEFMDELDGFNKDQELIFVLTTNDIERLEQAIKNRPGRINQCILFDLPSSFLRKKYLESYFTDYKLEDCDLDFISQKVGSVSQAFLKELVKRSIQFSFEKNDFSSHNISINQDSIMQALNEMKMHGNKSVGSIVGFNLSKETI
ncbi:MAG: AAA family ATPase [Candidatus Caenarcaniphilales bacterium]|nr:AAA family ATPase [Candidatus Caenarcaniphilales bacterium]